MCFSNGIMVAPTVLMKRTPVFGPHKLLPEEEFRILWRLLRCIECEFRRLYHRLAVNEQRKNPKANRRPNRCVPARPFHDLARAIRVVLSDRHNESEWTVNSLSSPNAFVCVINRSRFHRSVCSEHRLQLFAALYGHALIELPAMPVANVDLSNLTLGSMCGIRPVRSDFFTLESDSDDDERDGDMISRGTGSLNIMFSISRKHSFHVVEANRKWKASYGNCKPQSSRLPSSIKSEKRVHFPINTPLVRVQYLRTYAQAAQLLRQDQTWLTAARERHMQKFLEAVNRGCSSVQAAALAEADSDSDQDETMVVATNPRDTNRESSKFIPPKSEGKRRRKKKSRKGHGTIPSVSDLNLTQNGLTRSESGCRGQSSVLHLSSSVYIGISPFLDDHEES